MQEISQGIARRVSVSAYCLTLTQQIYHGEKMLLFKQICYRWGTPAYWSLVPRSSMFYLFEFYLKNMWNCSPTQQILSHSFYDWKLLLQQVVGIPMGTNCAPLLADLFLHSYESEFLQKLVKDKKIHEARAFNFTYRYIDEAGILLHMFGKFMILKLKSSRLS
jgi:hypothetical protein